MVYGDDRDIHRDRRGHDDAVGGIFVKLAWQFN